MELAARPAVAAGVAVAAAGLIAATPALTPALPEVHLPDIQLTSGGGTDAGSILQDVLSQQLAQGVQNFGNGLGTNATGSLLTQNANFVASELKFEEALYPLVKQWETVDFGTPANQSILNGALNRMFEANGMMFNGSEQSLAGLLGYSSNPNVASPFDITNSLLVDANNAHNLFDSGAIGGLEGSVAQNLLAQGDFVGLINDQNNLTGDAALHGPTAAMFTQLQDAYTTLNDHLITAETAFNGNLLSSEVAMEQAVFGNDSALNGAVNRGFNAFNMMYDAQEQSLNGMLGATQQGLDPQDITQSLLTGPSAQIFNDGSVGGLMGASDQSLAQLFDIAGLKPADVTDLFGHFDASAFQTAFGDFTQALAAGPFADFFGSGVDAGDVTAIFTDLHDIIASFF